jgi:DNA-binding GntR family transcriptional regulator
MNKMIPLIYEAIFKGVALSEVYDKAVEETLADHRMIIDFMAQRNAEGARNAMRIHILHAINSLKLN